MVVNSASPPGESERERQRPGVHTGLGASTYDIIPTMAAPQATSINALSCTPDLRFWMTGGSDGYVRKYDGPNTINGKQQLTVAQRHPFVDSVTKAAILMSYWENGDPTVKPLGDEIPTSPVYSLAINSTGLWVLAGTEVGAINLQTVRHDEGKRIHLLFEHTNAVSAMRLAPDERSFLSGGWDKRIFDWDLEDGHIIRSFEGNSGQISVLEPRPLCGGPVPQDAYDEEDASINRRQTFSSSNDQPFAAGSSVYGFANDNEGNMADAKKEEEEEDEKEDANANAKMEDAEEEKDSLFGGSSDAGSYGDGLDNGLDNGLADGLDNGNADGQGQGRGHPQKSRTNSLGDEEEEEEESELTEAGAFMKPEAADGVFMKPEPAETQDDVDEEEDDDDHHIHSSTEADAFMKPEPEVFMKPEPDSSPEKVRRFTNAPIATPPPQPTFSPRRTRRMSARKRAAGAPAASSPTTAAQSQSESSAQAAQLPKQEEESKAAAAAAAGAAMNPPPPSAASASSPVAGAGQASQQLLQEAHESESRQPPVKKRRLSAASAAALTTLDNLRKNLVIGPEPGLTHLDPSQASATTFLSAGIDGVLRLWDRRVQAPLAMIRNRPGVPPWCMGACWSTDGNWIYTGRRNGVVEEFNIHSAKRGWEPERTLKFPAGSGPISAVRAMVNGRHLVCASHDILRLYDLQDSRNPNSTVPFQIIPGPPRAGVISNLFVDKSARFMLTTGGNRGWEGSNTEVLIGYEIYNRRR